MLAKDHYNLQLLEQDLESIQVVVVQRIRHMDRVLLHLAEACSPSRNYCFLGRRSRSLVVDEAFEGLIFRLGVEFKALSTWLRSWR